MEQEPTPNGKNTIDSTDSSGNKKMEIEINRYKQLVDALNNPRILAKVIIVVAIIVVLVFCGISMVSLMLKKFYPYKSISTMQSGATIIQNEDTEVIYWLFNSADLWANSGIKVEEGDVITVRASGAFHTAIHHAVEDARKNNTFRDDWIRPTGGRKFNVPRDEKRMNFRVMPHALDNVLLMQVIPDKYINTGKGWLKWPKSYVLGYLDGGINVNEKNGKDTSSVSIVIIGEEKRDIRIPHDGVLHFAVNDIVLTERKIEEMRDSVRIDTVQTPQKGSIEVIYRDRGPLELGAFPTPKHTKELGEVITYMDSNQTIIKEQRYRGKELSTQIGTLKSIYSKYEGKGTTLSTQDTITIRNIITQNLTELDYYKMYHFVDAWFVDNVGSILIAIERKKK